MAFTTTTARVGRLNYLVALLVAAVGLVAGVAIVSLQDGSSGGSATARTAAASSIQTYESSQPTMVFYLVDSQEMADRINRSEAEFAYMAMDSNYPMPARNVHVTLATTPEEQDRAIELAGLASMELMQSGTLFDFVDLRGR